MSSYVFPEEWRNLNIDPVFAMLLTKAYNGQAEMMQLAELYSCLVNFEREMRSYELAQQIYKQGRGAPPVDPRNMANAALQNYQQLEKQRHQEQLQRQRQEVLQQPLSHLHAGQQESVSQRSSNPLSMSGSAKSASKNLTSSSSSPGERQEGQENVQSSQAPQRPHIKTEILETPATPRTPSSCNSQPQSVLTMAVRPAPASVAEVAPHLPASGAVGKGQKVIAIRYAGSHIGPIHVHSDEEVKALHALVTEKISEFEARGKR